MAEEKGVTAASSRWRGCWPRARTSSRSPAPSGAATWRRTWRGRRRARRGRPGPARRDRPARGRRRRPVRDAAYAYGNSPERSRDRDRRGCSSRSSPRRSPPPWPHRAQLGFHAVLVEPDARLRNSASGRSRRWPAGRARRRAGVAAADVVRHRPPPRRPRRAAAGRAGPAGALDRDHGQPAARGAARGRAGRARCARRRGRPRAPADRAGHRVAAPRRDRRRHARRAARRPQRPIRRLRLDR